MDRWRTFFRSLDLTELCSALRADAAFSDVVGRVHWRQANDFVAEDLLSRLAASGHRGADLKRVLGRKFPWRAEEIGALPESFSASSWTLGVASPDVGDSARRQVLEWLDANVRAPKTRARVLAAGGHPGARWEDLPALLDTASRGTLKAMLLSEAEPADVADLLAALEAPPDYARIVAEEYREALRAADADLRAGRPGDAERRYRTLREKSKNLLGLETRPEERAGLRRVLNAALLGLCVLHLDDEAPDLIKEIEEDGLDDGERAVFARVLLALGREQEATDRLEGLVGPGAEAVRQLVQLQRGEIPENLSEDADVQLRAAALHLSGRRAADAVDLALAALAVQLTEHGRALAAHVLVNALGQAWMGIAVAPLSAPGAALDAVRRCLRERAASPGSEGVSWEIVERGRAQVELDPDAALVLPSPTPAWWTELEPWIVSGELHGGAELLARWPRVGPVLVAVADRSLQHGRVDDTIDLLQRAVALVPGRGQRVRLGLALAQANRLDEVDVQIEALDADDSDEVWELRALSAVRRRRGGVAVVERWVEVRPTSAVARGWLAFACYEAGDPRRARLAAHVALDLPGPLALPALWQLAGIGLDATAPADHALVARVRERILKDFPGDPSAADMVSRLLRVSGEVSPDLDLGQATVTEVLSVDAFVQRLVGLADAQRARERLWHRGGMSFEAWASGQRSGLAGWQFQHRTLRVPAPIPPLHGSAGWRGRRCLIGALGIEILVALDLHIAFADAVGAVVVFEDVFDRVRNGGIGADAAIAEGRRSRLERVWRPFARLPERDASNGEVLAADQLDAVLGWLAACGRLARRDGAVWSPRPDGAVVAESLIEALDHTGGGQLFVDECRRQGVALAVLADDMRSYDAELAEARRVEEAARLGAAAHVWLAGLPAGRCEVLAVPPGPPLPARVAPDPASLAVGGVTEGVAEIVYAPLDGIHGRCFAAREAIRADRDLVLIAAELVEHGVLGAGPEVLLAGRAWTDDGSREHQARYVGIGAQVATLAAVVRDLVPAERRAEALDRLLRAGYVDAPEPADILALCEAYGDLRAAEPRERLAALVTGADEPSAATAARVMHLASVFAETMATSWFELERDRDEGALRKAATRNEALLDAVADLDETGRGRLGILDGVFYFNVQSALTAPVGFASAIDETTITVGPDSLLGRWWTAIKRWIGRTPARGAALGRALAAAVREGGVVAPLDQGWVLGTLVMPRARPGVLGIDDAAFAAIALRPRLAPALELPQIRGRSVGAWFRDAAGVAREHPDIATTLEGLAVRLDVHGTPVEVPLEAVLGGLDRARRESIAWRLLSLDGALARALLAVDGSVERDTALVAAFDRSPARAVREDPTVILRWSRHAPPWVQGPRSLADLLALLDEPADERSEHLSEAIGERLSDGGRWANAAPEMASQLSAIPGAAAALRIRRFKGDLSDENLLRCVAVAENPHREASSHIADVIVLLAMAAANAPVRRVGDRVIRPGELAAQVAAAALTTEPKPDDFASHEPGVLRACDSVVEALAPGLRPDRHTWLAWRLFAWLLDVLAVSPAAPDAVRTLARAGGPPAPLPRCWGDLYDPRRFGPGRVDIRERIVLDALELVRRAQHPDFSEPRPQLDWRVLQPALTAVLSRPYTPDEAAIRERWPESSLGGIALVGPDASRGLLLALGAATIADLEPPARLRILADALARRDGPTRLRTLSNMTLLGYLGSAWSEPELKLVRDALNDPDFVLDDFGRRALLLRAWTFEPTYGERAANTVLAALFEPLADHLAAFWFQAAAHHGVLAEVVATLRAALKERGIDEAPLLLALSAPRLSNDEHVRDQARAVLRTLAEEPALRDALAELLRYDPPEEAA